jgi:hypothetical protein
MKGRNVQSFQVGAGTAPEEPHYLCADCGYESSNRRHFRSADNGKTCSTGHYEKDGELKRSINPYARRR